MESDLGKLFIGGISWDTNEDRLKEYFETYGEVVEAVIMKDRTTGRARGFGFVVYADPVVAERVVVEKHQIDGRTVEAKKAVPRDDQHILNRTNSSVHVSPGPTRTKKIFIGGLASTVTETDLKNYFDQFGMITDAVVMYDHNTQRPRGFGFITFESEESVEKVLFKTFHELNGKMVEVKQAVPKELSPGPSRSPVGGYNYGLNRMSSLLSNYSQGPGFSPSVVGAYGLRMDSRYSPVPGSRGGIPSFGPQGYGLGMNFEHGLNPNYGGSANFSANIGYARGPNSYYAGSPNRYGSSIGFNGGTGGIGSLLSPTTRSVWGNAGLGYGANSTNSNSSIGSGNLGVSPLGNNGSNWGTNPISAQGGRSASNFSSGNLGYGIGNNNYGLGGGGGYGNNTNNAFDPSPSYGSSSGGYDDNYGEFYGGNSVYGDPTWRSASSELEGSKPFGFGLGDVASDVTAKGSAGYTGGYNVTSRQSNRGIVT